MNHNDIFSLSFPEAKTIIVSGDIHGDFNQLVFKLCIQYQLTNTLLIPDFVIVSPKNLRQRILLFSDVLPSAWFGCKPPCSEVA